MDRSSAAIVLNIKWFKRQISRTDCLLSGSAPAAVCAGRDDGSPVPHLAAGHLAPLRELRAAAHHPQHLLPHAQVPRRPALLRRHPQLLQPAVHHPLHHRGRAEDIRIRSQGRLSKSDVYSLMSAYI